MIRLIFARPVLPLFALPLLLAPAPLPAQTGGAPYSIDGRGFARLQEAVDAIGDGEGVIRIAPGYHRDCAVQSAGRVAFVAAEPGRAIFDGVACEGKAALVLRGAGARVEGLVFQNMRVPDGNGAGIRLERSDLEVADSLFRNSEEGILTADDPRAALTIDRSTFSRLGRCDRGLSCAHSVYTGIYGRLTVTRTRFEKGSGGHYLKSRAVVVDVSDNSFDDTQGTGTNYMIDLPSGSVGRITGNLFVQGRDKENYSALIAVAAEERKNPSRGLSIANNRARLPDDMERKSVFVADWSGEPLAIAANDLGPGLTRFEKR
ncbi:right-handed parallel beta-helix repeat-containing protein [Sphingopyxis sp. XHP0097]|uniref:Right-handed parallel beta-helix repeat-containing protein n=1 Tax=Sphingopyxis jiangsuensis TaxID=2871171 RepID=A0ABS7MAK4_9SPHN|nr:MULTISPECIES: right-handed parallel beta-helix repeat-containing protein [Sphingopyxis]MBL0769995.1 right-handed parallel beta-helix repeat-containing protein [Sphingopyxis lutea]MBY4635796.1 right-handed parallel beta-helix repeat-containing protein [Sphingopyxis jiangsuensis]